MATRKSTESTKARKPRKAATESTSTPETAPTVLPDESNVPTVLPDVSRETLMDESNVPVNDNPKADTILGHDDGLIAIEDVTPSVDTVALRETITDTHDVENAVIGTVIKGLDVTRVMSFSSGNEALNATAAEIRNAVTTLTTTVANSATTAIKEMSISLYKMRRDKTYTGTFDNFETAAQALGFEKGTANSYARAGAVYTDETLPETIKEMTPSKIATINSLLENTETRETVINDATTGKLSADLTQAALKEYSAETRKAAKESDIAETIDAVETTSDDTPKQEKSTHDKNTPVKMYGCMSIQADHQVWFTAGNKMFEQADVNTGKDNIMWAPIETLKTEIKKSGYEIYKLGSTSNKDDKVSINFTWGVSGNYTRYCVISGKTVPYLVVMVEEPKPPKAVKAKGKAKVSDDDAKDALAKMEKMRAKMLEMGIDPDTL